MAFLQVMHTENGQEFERPHMNDFCIHIINDKIWGNNIQDKRQRPLNI